MLTATSQLRASFYMPPGAATIYEMFHEIAFMDGSFGSSVFGLSVVVFGVFDNTDTIIPIFYGLAPSENHQDVCWMFDKFFTMVPNRPDMQPRLLFTDSGSGFIKGARLALPHTHHRYCVWHTANDIRHPKRRAAAGPASVSSSATAAAAGAAAADDEGDEDEGGEDEGGEDEEEEERPRGKRRRA